MRKMMTKGNILFGVATIFLVFMIALCMACTVKSESGQTNRQQAGYYQAMAKESVRLTRGLLEQEGYRNSGVVITRVSDETVTEYTLTIHHDKISELSCEETKQLTDKIKGLDYPSDLGDIKVCFLEN